MWAICDTVAFLEKVLQDDLVIPRFTEFADDINSIYEYVGDNCDEGAVASYIPDL